MAKGKDSGGDAFPNGFVRAEQCGMSLRDYFAGEALMGLCADYGETTCQASGIHENLAMIAYRIADAMLTEREKG